MPRSYPCPCQGCVNGRHAGGDACRFCSGRGWYFEGDFNGFCPYGSPAPAVEASSSGSDRLSADEWRNRRIDAYLDERNELAQAWNDLQQGEVALNGQAFERECARLRESTQPGALAFVEVLDRYLESLRTLVAIGLAQADAADSLLHDLGITETKPSTESDGDT